MTSPQSAAQIIVRCLTELRVCVGSPSYDAGENELTFAAYAERLARYEPAVVRAACKRAAEEFTRWPPLAELLRVCDEERAKLAEQRMKLPAPETDWWHAPGSARGTGLLVASGQYLLRGFARAEARREFNRVVDALGFARGAGGRRGLQPRQGPPRHHRGPLPGARRTGAGHSRLARTRPTGGRG